LAISKTSELIFARRAPSTTNRNPIIMLDVPAIYTQHLKKLIGKQAKHISE